MRGAVSALRRLTADYANYLLGTNFANEKRFLRLGLGGGFAATEVGQAFDQLADICGRRARVSGVQGVQPIFGAHP